MTREQKQTINAKLRELYFDSRMNTNSSVRQLAAAELVGVIECVTLMGCGISGYDIYGHLISCPAVTDNPSPIQRPTPLWAAPSR